MAKLQIPISEDLMAAAKIFALQNKTTLKEVVTQAITAYVQNTQNQTEQPAQPQPTQETPPTQYDFILKKTHKVGKPLKENKRVVVGPLSWILWEGCQEHYDENNTLIPFVFTNEVGKVYEPDEEQMKELEDCYGKVKNERLSV